MTNATCSLPSCAKPIKRAGYCYSHYMKNWRYGTPEPEFASRIVDLVGQRFGTLVVVERVRHQWRCDCDCGAERRVSAGDLNRCEDVTCGNRSIHRRRDDAGYTAAHQRVRQDRGHIQSYDCTDCGDTARHWSYNHDDPAERLAYGLSANPVAYSLDPSHYSPRCVSCHKRFDLGRIDSARIA